MRIWKLARRIHQHESELGSPGVPSAVGRRHRRGSSPGVGGSRPTSIRPAYRTTGLKCGGVTGRNCDRGTCVLALAKDLLRPKTLSRLRFKANSCVSRCSPSCAEQGTGIRQCMPGVAAGISTGVGKPSLMISRSRNIIYVLDIRLFC